MPGSSRIAQISAYSVCLVAIIVLLVGSGED
jgi:hypothetical protein